MKIGELLGNSQYGISISMNEDRIGYPIYRMNEISKMLTKSEVEKYADINKNELNSFKLNDKDVLFNRTNSLEWVGRTGIFYKNSEKDFIFASYLVRFNTNEKFCLPEYLTAFLNSKFGVEQLKSRVRESINQANINPEEVKEIEIPLLDMKLQKLVESRFLIANKNKIISENLYKEAQEILLKELNLDNYKLLEENISIKSLSASFLESGRLDAEYYQPKYDDIIKKIKIYKNGYGKLKDYIKEYSTGFAFKSCDYIEDGVVKLIRINNIINGDLDIKNSVSISNEVAEQTTKDFVKKYDILISMSGTIGSACVIRDDIEAVVNQRIFRFSVKDYDSFVLALILNSRIGKTQLDRIGTGGVQTNISSNDIKNILVPKIDFNIQQKISEKIQKSFYLKERSEQLLENSVKAVEIAIEKTEEEAVKYLEEEIKKINIEI
ncbi:hypothetical protein [Sebaldella sp. S0638]|uniref:restriction endonuclease subunit S n=1 Tax=Sebaldella sp. S0638 TaxID=2957809 RepID=UPI00209D94E7|nr:hypothetical protein [Sebaldella sp. S0638]MCP1226479.1 hypothetical protein [Sebaldella sp. S0638]